MQIPVTFSQSLASCQGLGSVSKAGPLASAQVVISSSFESAVGLSKLAQLAAAVDASWEAAAPPQASSVSAILGSVLHWGSATDADCGSGSCAGKI